ncbi:aconitate hydratase AcnA [Vagococcus elongatus]|uniref:Aconitate hydratase n=1 Tax=Vagococcus elongatus TaxID=180344 RepID=A0A430B5Y1_9ENTE|nr:aconitate hydratase AcnA [Vagococcus elongatus]RSU15720.1 aconitate hydratase 1 [Vagococcus elongatus]
MSSFKENSRRQLLHDDQEYYYYDLESAARQSQADLQRLPYTIRILLESLIRQEDGLDITEKHIEQLMHWEPHNVSGEIPFKPARVILQDFTGVPAVVDLASMREAIVKLGGKADQINPEVPVDLVIDHSVQVDAFGNEKALQKNSRFEFLRNKERYEFLKWAQQAFSNYRVVPPATGIVHQVNLEYLADVVKTGKENDSDVLYPDTVFGTDSHTPMVNGLGVLGWGVGGIEAEACMLGEPSYFPTPEVIGVKFTGTLAPAATATDLALKVTQVLREKNVVGKFVEYFGEGIQSLTLADRATIANMSPENGATCGFFPVDEETLNYLRLTGRKEEHIKRVAAYLKTNHLFYEEGAAIEYSDVVEIDLSTIQSNLAGPKRPQDLIPLTEMKESFEKAVTAPEGNQGFGLPETELNKKALLELKGENYELTTGSVVIAAITSCTNTSNPYVMLAAGLVAKKAVDKGLKVAPFVKTSLSPGSQVVTGYLEDSGLLPYLEALGFYLVGYGCTTCIGNSGPLDEEVEETIKAQDLLVTSVLSGNRNFEGRIHPLTKANYLASPPLVVAYALAGNVNKNLAEDPLGFDTEGQPVYLKDIWPTPEEINELIVEYVTPEIFQKYYADVFAANQDWNDIKTSEGATYQWDDASTYIANPPFFEDLSLTLDKKADLHNLRVLAKFGDSVTTDHISPAGAISSDSPAGKYLLSHDVSARNFNSFGSRRGHHEVMMRGTFGNIRIRNQIADGIEGGYTTYWPTGEIMSIYDAAMKNQKDEVGSVILAGADYGMGSSRDWAAKGSKLLGVKAVIAKSFERIHRSNLVMMGILPLQFIEGEDAHSLGLTGSETFTISLPKEPGIHEKVKVEATDASGNVKEFMTIARFDAQADIRYYQHQGILPMVIRKKLGKE